MRRNGGEVSQVGQNIHHGDYRHGYDDRQGQVPTEGKVSGHLRNKRTDNILSNNSNLEVDTSRAPTQIQCKLDEHTNVQLLSTTTTIIIITSIIIIIIINTGRT